MQKWKEWLGVRTWLGLAVGLLLSLALDAVGALCMAQGWMPEMPWWVYGSYALGALAAVRIAAQGKHGTLAYVLVLLLLMGGVSCLLGLVCFGGVSLRPHGTGVLLGLAAGGLCAGLMPTGKGRTEKKRSTGSSANATKRRKARS